MNYNQKKDVRNQISDITSNNLCPGCENCEQRLREQAQSSNSNKGNGGNVIVNNNMVPGSNISQNFGTVNHYNGTQNEIDPHEAFKIVVRKLIARHIIIHKQDFAILYQLEMEMNELGIESAPQMVKLVKTISDMPDSLLPSESNIKSFDPRRKVYPNWDFGDMEYGQISHKKTVAKNYIREMAKYEFYHPSCESSTKNAQKS